MVRVFRVSHKTLLLLWFVVCIGCSKTKATRELYFVTSKGDTPVIAAEIADTTSTRALGLMYRRELAHDQGMLFVFPSEDMRSFWMKNTYLELDIIYMDKKGEVVSIIHRARPLTETPRLSAAPSQYVVEVAAGLAKKWGVDAGDSMRFTSGIFPTAKK